MTDYFDTKSAEGRIFNCFGYNLDYLPGTTTPGANILSTALVKKIQLFAATPKQEDAPTGTITILSTMLMRETPSGALSSGGEYSFLSDPKALGAKLTTLLPKADTEWVHVATHDVAAYRKQGLSHADMLNSDGSYGGAELIRVAMIDMDDGLIKELTLQFKLVITYTRGLQVYANAIINAGTASATLLFCGNGSRQPAACALEVLSMAQQG